MTNYKSTMSQQGLLYHHGIKGQKWGVRRYQNPDGSLTAKGEKRYRKAISKKWFNDPLDKAVKEKKESIEGWKEYRNFLKTADPNDDYVKGFTKGGLKQEINYSKRMAVKEEKELRALTKKINDFKQGNVSVESKMAIINEYDRLSEEDKKKTRETATLWLLTVGPIVASAGLSAYAYQKVLNG